MLAVLSNTNCDPIVRRLQRSIECMDNVGYGSVFEALLNPHSQLSITHPEHLIILIDLREYIQIRTDFMDVIDSFFKMLSDTVKTNCRYYISDSFYYTPFEISYRGNEISRQACLYWDEKLNEMCNTYHQCCVFPFKNLVNQIGTKAFYSDKLWILGGVRYSMQGVKSICKEVERIVNISKKAPLKAILLDLDNTIWGGTAGEDGIEGIKLADSGVGKAYKEFQMLLQYLKDSGIILSIVSKNNEKDAWDVIENHPHMLLKKNDFVANRVNWINKSINIKEISEELNIGLDSILFIDDNPLERQEVKALLPQVEVPEFPEEPEELLQFGDHLLKEYFGKIEVTQEDKNKLAQYQAKEKIEHAKRTAETFETFLTDLHIVLVKKDPKQYIERLAQLVQKTNQFNTTVMRYTMSELTKMIESAQWRLFCYEVKDKYANHGVCVLAIVHLKPDAEIANFIMSCRVMGRNLEYGVLQDIEYTLQKEGIKNVRALFKAGPKNAPVQMLYENAGYQLIMQTSKEKHYLKEMDTKADGKKFYGEVCDI